MFGYSTHVTDRSVFTPVIVGIAMVKTAREMYPDHFQWRQNEYEYEFGETHSTSSRERTRSEKHSRRVHRSTRSKLRGSRGLASF
jgi:uncharacterized protein YbbC (DUF1343 family)